MQVTETLSEGLKRGFTVVVPAADIESRRAAKFADIGKQVRMPGFRPGKVPMPVVRQRFGKDVSAEVLQESVSAATQQVISDRGLRPATEPKVDLVTDDPASPAAAKDVEFKVELEILPEITPPDFAAIELTRLRAEVPPERADEALARMAKARRTLHDIDEDRGAAAGEVLTVDFSGRIDGEPIEGAAGTDVAVDVSGEGFIPGFSEQLEGMKPGETRTIDVTFPADYAKTEVAGKAAQFEVAAKKLQRAELAPIDDALAKEVGFDDLAEMRNAMTARYRAEFDQVSRLRLKRQLLDALASLSTFAIPDSLVDIEFAQIWARLQSDKADGRLDAEDRAKSDEDLRTEYRAIAERRVRLGLLLSEVGRANGITVAPEEMTRAMRTEASRYPGQEQQVMEFFRRTPRAAESLRGPIFEDKVVDFVLELAKVTDQTVTPDELMKDPAEA
jgi:trigger factor